jgi:acyl carrier protein
MTRDDIRGALIRALAEVAPETDASRIDPHANLRDALDLDSMDFLNFVVGVHQQLHVEVPETDYPKMRTLDACVSYVASRLGVP